MGARLPSVEAEVQISPIAVNVEAGRVVRVQNGVARGPAVAAAVSIIGQANDLLVTGLVPLTRNLRGILGAENGQSFTLDKHSPSGS